MPSITYDKPVFWTPVNATGKVATVNGTRDSQLFKLNLYWSGMLLATQPKTQANLDEEVSGFLKVYIPKDDEQILHFESNEETFHKIVDPGWTPGQTL
jgi:hypothetical protein